jgi:hypothetical protein
MSRICLYFRREPERDRWLPGDRFVRPLVRAVVRGRPRPGGIDKVFINLCLGLDRLDVPYEVNLPFEQLSDDDRVGVIGVGRHVLQGYDRPNPIVAGIALMTYPSEWPTLCEDYPVAFYLQHSAWANDVYRPYFKEKCRVWPVGIHTGVWAPTAAVVKRFDFLIYDKILWRRDEQVPRLLEPIRDELARRRLTSIELQYGRYDELRYMDVLATCRAMIFLCEHESQGIAYQECLASGVPILAWDQGRYLDPSFLSGGTNPPATSVPYFDERCGLRFRNIQEFPEHLTRFLELQRSGAFAPRAYIIDNLSLEKCAEHYLQILEEAQGRHVE